MKSAIPVALVLWLSSCSQPKEIAAFAALAERATVSFANLAQSVVSNCEILQKRQDSNRDRIFKPTKPLFVDGGDPMDTKACAGSVETAQALRTAHKVVEEYMATLRILASDNILITKPADGALDSLSGPLKLSTAQSNALKGLSNSISKAFTDGYRRKQLAQMIAEADDSLQATMEVFGTLIDNQISDKFANSEGRIKSYYLTGIAFEAEKDPGGESIATRLWIQQGEAELESLQARKRAATAYRKVLSEIAKGHAKLKEANGNWKSLELASFLFQSARSIEEEQQKVERAFAGKK